MKLHLSLNQPDLSGYININVAKQPIDFGKLDNICAASECTDMVVNDVLKFVPYESIPGIIKHWESRLRHKAKVTFIFTDFNSLMRKFATGNIDEKILNQLLFLNGSHSCFSSEYLISILEAVKLNIISIAVGEQTVIIVERP